MRSSCWLLFGHGDVWQIAKVDRQTSSIATTEAVVGGEPDEVARAIAEALAGNGYQGESVVLGLDSASCLAVDFAADDARRTDGRKTLLYDLEQWLPLAAEELAADFVLHRNHVLGIAVETVPVARMVESLEARGVPVQTISPLALLTLQTLIASIAGGAPDVVLWTLGNRIELFHLVDGRPGRWCSIPAEPAAVRQALQMFGLGQAAPLQVVAWQPDEALTATLSGIAEIEWRGQSRIGDSDAVEAALETARGILAGQWSPWIELRRDGLASSDPYRLVRGLLRMVGTTAAMLLLTLVGVFWYRGLQYERLAEDCQREQALIFQRVLPGQRVPAGIRKRLESECAKIAGLRGEAADLPESASARTPFHRLLAGLPASLPVRLLEIRVDRDRIDSLQGEVRSFGDHQQLTESLRAQGFEIEPSPSENLPGGRGVSLRISNAKWRGES